MWCSWCRGPSTWSASQIIAITTLDLLNVPLTAFAFVSGALAIGFGFGAQNIINNFISGWILMWERPIRSRVRFRSVTFM